MTAPASARGTLLKATVASLRSGHHPHCSPCFMYLDRVTKLMMLLPLATIVHHIVKSPSYQKFDKQIKAPPSLQRVQQTTTRDCHSLPQFMR